MDAITPLLLPILIFGLGSILQVSVGFGFALFVVPLLSAVRPDLVPGPFIFASGIFMATVVYRNRAALAGYSIKPVIIGILLGSPIGALLISYFRNDYFNVIIASAIFVGIAASLCSSKVPVNKASQLIAGLASGLMGTASGVGGPPIALLYQHENGAAFRALLSLVFTFASFIAIMFLAIFGQFALQDMSSGLFLLFGIALGHLVGPKLARYFDANRTRPVILAISCLSAIWLLVKI